MEINRGHALKLANWADYLLQSAYGGFVILEDHTIKEKGYIRWGINSHTDSLMLWMFDWEVLINNKELYDTFVHPAGAKLMHRMFIKKMGSETLQRSDIAEIIREANNGNDNL